MLIGEVSERSGVSARMLRHYDRLGVRSRAQFARARGGDTGAIDALVAHVVVGEHDIEAGDLLAMLAGEESTARTIAGVLRDAATTATAPGRRRIAATLAPLPGSEAAGILSTLAADPDRGVALTAAAVLTARDSPTRR
ncbi:MULTISPECIES: MerR family DNA-binding transcriptional regulator [unclassified Microbacterium]|uniref:MerR family DNA-binding transcriptional regulator n=1 Tax=unclassified Microbacterium TaxID=2609290 RepID=UPI00214AE865|nr:MULTISPECIES: MerR family DNA-binding transcriptional regulator [unclassified Microbacterium]MCR2785852.1 MerR family DNA-binding transcriptional regulator [Microbacterium sp. zg.B96]WIM17171.1 MerR family DNA-binding transcriptional regulator [Microbacterium sp. zg-B96]